MWKKLLDFLPRGHDLPQHEWDRRHHLLIYVLLGHVGALALIGLVLGTPFGPLALWLVPIGVLALLGRALSARRRLAATLITAGLVYCSAVLVVITHGAIEAHFHFFIVVGFIALYQDWAPFLFNIAFTFLSHGIGSAFAAGVVFAHVSAQRDPWLWSSVHGAGVLFTCVGVMVFWRLTEEQQIEKDEVARQLSELEIGRRQFTSDLLVNLARRNQSMLYRQLEIINQLEETERDPDALAELFRLDHLATRVRRNSENLFVLSGEQSPRVWSEPVALRDVVRAAIAETEDLDRVVFTVDEWPAVLGHTVTDLTHLLAELTENAVRYSPPQTSVTIRHRLDGAGGGHLLTVEDWGVGMPAEELAEANTLLARPPEVDLSVAQRLGLHVVARLAARHDIRVSLSATPGSGLTAVLVLPAAMFVGRPASVPATQPAMPGPLERLRPAGSDAAGSGSGFFPAPGTNPAAAGVRAGVGTLEPRPEAVPDRPVHSVIPAQAVAPLTESAPGNWNDWWSPGDDAGGAPGGPGPAPASGPVSSAGPAGADRGGRPTGPPRGPLPPPAPGEPAARLVEPTPAGPDAGPSLKRRVPQASLAPELRLDRDDAPTPPPVPAIPPQAAAGALSRYQASRRAAQAATGENHGHRDGRE